ncbi:MAG TPA: response regulator [Chloroflexi bacterium]|nr:response regulator [Chloroflexota bacterium]
MADARILLVDDERLVRRSMEKTLFRAGFDVDTAEDVSGGLALFEEALEDEEEGPFDIAILDLNMPNFEGVEDANAGLKLLSKLLELDDDLPVVVLTAFDEVERAKEAVKRGARAYFVKGREAELLDIVNDILDESE